MAARIPPRKLASTGVIALLLLVPLMTTSPYVLHLFIMVLLWVLLGQSWNLIGGFTGQISYGHAAFFGMGAYTTGLIVNGTGDPGMAWWGIPAGGLASVVLSIVIGWICFRLRGPYFGLSVLALSEVLRLVTLNWKEVTNGAEGILFIPVFNSKVAYYYIALGILLLSMGILWRVIHSKLGYYFLAIREDQDAAESLGINTTKYKLISLMISAFFAGVAGSFYMNYLAFIDPGIAFHIQNISIMMILVTILGGVATIWGPFVGATLFILISEGFRVWVGAGHLVFFGVLIIVIILFFPNGIVGAYNDFIARRSRTSAPANGTGMRPAAGTGAAT